MNLLEATTKQRWCLTTQSCSQDLEWWKSTSSVKGWDITLCTHSSKKSLHATLRWNQEWKYKNAEEWSNIASGPPNRLVCPNGSDPQAKGYNQSVGGLDKAQQLCSTWESPPRHPGKVRRCKVLHKAGYKLWILVNKAVWKLKTTHNLHHALRSLLLQSAALWNKLRLRNARGTWMSWMQHWPVQSGKIKQLMESSCSTKNLRSHNTLMLQLSLFLTSNLLKTCLNCYTHSKSVLVLKLTKAKLKVCG